ncbi:enolase C-terminal domain-like protein [Micromonospora soli]|nr:enolase C-terminal domain-like protein [Micromonospora sp. NBRC 110009]WKT98582.1 enolase C-terminal domain-like protein [Micromonospora sp. NBRC 110009]
MSRSRSSPSTCTAPRRCRVDHGSHRCGERLHSRADFLPALQSGIAVAQPDLAHCGGISEGRRIASLAEV